MDKLGDIFNAFYTQFILRDVLGKIMPGLILVLVISTGFFNKPSEIIKCLSNLSLMLWLVILGAAWLAGLAVQSFGELRVLPQIRRSKNRCQSLAWTSLLEYLPGFPNKSENDWSEFIFTYHMPSRAACIQSTSVESNGLM